jgi:hypothetical protein
VLPFFTAGQTVHVEDNRIVYKGTFKLEKMNRTDVYSRAKASIAHYVNDSIGQENMIDETTIVSVGNIRLNSPYHLIKTLHYTIALNADDGQCQYRIDSVYITQKERGGTRRKFSSGELLKAMDVFGPVASLAEKQLNEIDMNFQKLIDLIGADLKRAPLNN